MSNHSSNESWREFGCLREAMEYNGLGHGPMIMDETDEIPKKHTNQNLLVDNVL